MRLSPILVIKSRKGRRKGRSRASIGRSPIHGNRPITMARIDSIGRDNPLKVGVKPYMQNLDNISYEMDQPPENRINIGREEVYDPEKHGPKELIPDRGTLQRRLLARDQKVHPSKRLGVQPRYLTWDGQYVVNPRFGSFWTAPTLQDLASIHPTAHEDKVRLLGTTVHPKDVSSQFRGPWQHREKAAEAFAEKEIKPEQLLDLTPVLTDEKGYSPYWYNHPEEKDPEHAYAEERKFANKGGIDMNDLMDLFRFTNSPNWKKEMYDYGDLEEFERKRKPLEQAMSFLREKIHPSEGHAMMQDLLMQDDIPKTSSILSRLSTDLPGDEFTMKHGSNLSELLRNPRYQKRVKEHLDTREDKVGNDYRELRRLYEEKGENPDSPENTTHILDEMQHDFHGGFGFGSRKRNSVFNTVKPEKGDLATLEDWKAYENLPDRKWSIGAPRSDTGKHLTEGHYDPRDPFGTKVRSQKLNPLPSWSDTDDDIWNQLKFNVGTLSAPNVRRELPYQWWSASERADPSWMGIQYQDFTDLARKVGEQQEVNKPRADPEALNAAYGSTTNRWGAFL